MPEIIDFKAMFEPIKQFLFYALRLPFELWYSVPWGYKAVIEVILSLFIIIILILVLKNKDKWQHRRY